MAERDDGMELIRQRMERASRRPPPPRRGGAPAGPAGPEIRGSARGVGESTTDVRAASSRRTPPSATASGVAPPARSARTRASSGSKAVTPMRLAPDLPSVNLAIRVRRPLDDRLADLIHRLRKDGVRTSKVELIEMLLWELGPDPAEAVARLGRFRDWAPRGAGAPLGGD